MFAHVKHTIGLVALLGLACGAESSTGRDASGKGGAGGAAGMDAGRDLGAGGGGGGASAGGAGGDDDGDAGADVGAGGGGASGTGGSGTGGAGGGGTGGTGGSGGVVDSGIDTGPTCVTPVYTHASTFGGTFDGWSVPNPNPTLSLTPGPGVDGGPPTGTVQTLDGLDGFPAPGSARLEIPFSDVGQQLLFAQFFGPPANLTGTTVSAQIKLDSGLLGNPVTSVARAFLVLKSTSAYLYATGSSINLDPAGGWTTLTVNADAPPTLPFGYTACDIREIDVEIDTGQQGTYTRAVVHIDTITVTLPGGADASAD